MTLGNNVNAVAPPQRPKRQSQSSWTGPMDEVNNVKNPSAVVTEVKNVAKPTSRKSPSHRLKNGPDPVFVRRSSV